MSELPNLIVNGKIIATLAKHGSNKTTIEIINVVSWNIGKVGTQSFLFVVKRDGSFNMLKLEDIQEIEVTS